MINESLSDTEEKCLLVKQSYDEHYTLWSTDLSQHFAEFKEDAQITTVNGQQLLDLKKYDAAITKYEKIRENIGGFQSPKDIGWLRINTQPVKTQLMTWTNRWIDMYVSFLKSTVNEKLSLLDQFMKKITKGLDLEVVERKEGKAALMLVMEDIRDVRKSMDTTLEIFSPLQDVLNCLKSHGTDIALLPKIADQPVQDYLDEAPLLWDAVVKKTFRKKEEILPMQMREVESLKAELEQFFLHIREFRNNFRANAPFTFTGAPNDAYRMMDKHAEELAVIEVAAKE